METWSPPLLLLLLLITAATTTTTGQVTNFYCLMSNTTYTANSAFSTNLQTALSSLSAASSTAKSSNTTVSSSSAAVYALYFCRYDLPLSDCHTCVSNATNYIVSFCPAQTEAVIWYEQCTLRYGTAPLNSLDSPYYWSWGGSLTSLQFADYNSTLESILKEAMDRAVNGSSAPEMRYFATGEGAYGKNQKVRCLVQCSPDLSAGDCGACLSEALNLMEENCVGADWGMVFKSNCMMRYGTAQFLAIGNSSAGGSASPTTSVSGGSGSSTGVSVGSSSALISQRYGAVEVARRVIAGALLVLCII